MSANARDSLWFNMPEHWPAATRLVALAMADVVNDMNKNRFWASAPSLADKTGLDDRSVRRAIHRLEAERWIRCRSSSPGKPKVYDWLGHPARETPLTACPPCHDARPVRKSGHPGQRDRGTPVTLSGVSNNEETEVEPNRTEAPATDGPHGPSPVDVERARAEIRALRDHLAGKVTG